jgi:tetratricopeptide (TPR) repeat protein
MATRVAFCISGQFRDDHLTLPRTAEIARAEGASVFVSTWRRRGTKSTGIIHLDQAARIFGSVFAQALPAQLCADVHLNLAVPELAGKLQGTPPSVTEDQVKAYFPTAIVDIEDENLCLDFHDPNVHDTNSLRLLYKNWRCNELKRVAEKQQGAPFDVVVRFRPDVVPHGQSVTIAAAADLSRTILVPYGGPSELWLNDILAISNSANADHYARLFGKALLEPRRKWDIIHVELFRHLEELGINIELIDIEQHITQDFEHRQPQARKALLDLIGSGRVTEGVFADPATWQNLHRLLTMAHRGEAGAEQGEILELLQGIDLRHADNECVGHVLQVISAVPRNAAAQLAQFATYAMALVCLTDSLGASSPATAWARRDFGQAAAILPPPLRAQLAAQGFVEQTICSAETPTAVRALLDLSMRRLDPVRFANLCDQIATVEAGSVEFLSALFHSLLGRDREAARGVAEAMIARFPDDWRGFDHFGHYCSVSGDVAGALAMARRAHAMDPTHGGLTCRVGEVLIAAGDWSEAIDWLEKAAGLWPDPRPWALHATALRRMGDQSGASEIVSRAIALFPESEPWFGTADA